MLTKEFIRRVEDLGYEVNVSMFYSSIRSDFDNNVIGTISEKDVNRIDTNGHFPVAHDLFDLMVEYAKTPVEERKVKLTDAERVILKNLEKRWKWINRNKLGDLGIKEDKPIKDKSLWINYNGTAIASLAVFSHLFDFIDWEDDEPYNIQELLEEEN